MSGTKLPPLPKLPRPGRSNDLPRAPKGSSDLPELRTKPVGPTPEDEVTPANNNWGGIEAGRWFETTDPVNSIGGRCCQCGGLKPAWKLRYALGPFGRWEGWACGPCRNERKGVEHAKQPRTGKPDKAPVIVAPIPWTPGELAKMWLAQNAELITWEGEGGMAR